MTILKEMSEITRDPDRGVLFGVCAGLSNYYGWSVRKTRLVAFVLLLIFNGPIVLAYLAAVILVPTVDQREEKPSGKAYPEAQGKPQYRGPLKQRYAQIEKRMRRVEAYLHGQEYQLRSAFRDLETS